VDFCLSEKEHITHTPLRYILEIKVRERRLAVKFNQQRIETGNDNLSAGKIEINVKR
jgi:hypothetical protein